THDGIRPCPTSTTSADITSSLSAIGSMNLPKSVTRLRARAIFPSSKSVSDAAQNSPSATYCAHLASTSANPTKNGTMHTRSSESRFGKFIPTTAFISFVPRGNGRGRRPLHPCQRVRDPLESHCCSALHALRGGIIFTF